VRLDVDSTGRIFVTTADSAGIANTIELPAQDIRCAGGKLRLATKFSIAAGGLVAAVGADSVSLSKAADGSLIVEGYTAAAGFVVATVGRGWMRFPVWGSTPTTADRFRSGRPYDWPRTSPPTLPPILLRERKPLYGAYSYDADDRWNRRPHSGCPPDPGDPSAASLARVRDALVTVPATAIIDEEFRATLPPPAPVIERTRYASTPAARAAEAADFGARHGAPAVIVVDVEVQFGAVLQGSCFVKLIATAEVRVQPAGALESKTPLYDIWAPLQRVPVEAWARDPAAARKELSELLRQIGRDLATSYGEWNG
jgi:hypothetical protein